MSQFDGARFERRKGPVSDVPVASRMLTLLEDTEARRRGISVQTARTSIARALRIPAATLRHLRNQRRKTVDYSVMGAIADRLVVVLQAEIAELDHELQIARQIGVDVRDDLFQEAAASIAAAKEILARAIGPS